MYVQEEKMVQNAARKIELADETKDAARKILDLVKADKRTSLTAPEGKLVCDAYGIPVPKEGVAKSAAEASKIATDMGFSGGHEDRLAGYPAQDRSRRRDGGSENISRRANRLGYTCTMCSTYGSIAGASPRRRAT